MRQALIDLGTVCAAVTAMIVAVGGVAKLPPVRWLWRRIVAEPFATWTRDRVLEVVDPLRDQMDRVVARVDEVADRTDEVAATTTEHMADEQERWESIDSQLGAIVEAVDRHLPEAAERNRRLDAHDRALGIDTRET